MKHLHASSVVLDAAAIIFLAAQPVWAQTTEITGVHLSRVNGGINVILTTPLGLRPQIFTTKKGNTLVADIINTQLHLPQGKSFRQDNPAPGIASVTVNQLDATTIQLTVTGMTSIPNSQPVVRQQNEIILGFSSTEGTEARATTPPVSPSPQQSQKPGVLVPSPQVSIDGTPTQAQAPPFLPRAVAPPVGDIAISNIDASPSNVDLGTQKRVDRLVLRNAPVREVLSVLARAAGLNLAFAGKEANGQPAGGQQGTTGSDGSTISLDIENEPVQDVFNYVLHLSGLEANRSGRTIFVGAKLPNSTRDVIVRGLRLNQVTVGTALNFLVALGAESAVSRERQVTSVNAVPVGGAANTAVTQTQTTTETRVETQRVDFKDSNPLLRGVQALGDERTNSITLVGSPRLIEIAMAQLTQLDVRRRQVVINVRIIDVNLRNTKDFNTSFSFGIGDNFFSNNGGAIGLNFGSRPNGVSRRFLASLQAQVTNGNAKILTDPTLTVQEGQEALVKLTAQVYGGIEVTSSNQATSSNQVAASNQVTASNQATASNSQFISTRKPIIKDAGLSLRVRVERVDDNGFVSLSVAPTVSAPNGAIQTPDDGEITLLSERSLQSGQIRLRDGQTLILSGIIQDSDRVSVTKVPILGDIPILGALFRRTNRTSDRSEVIVLLTPQIVEDSERSSFGYNYTPSPDVRKILERGGMHVPKP